MKRLTESQVEEIRTLHREGWSEREIARKMGCSRSAVWARLQTAKSAR